MYHCDTYFPFLILSIQCHPKISVKVCRTCSTYIFALLRTFSLHILPSPLSCLPCMHSLVPRHSLVVRVPMGTVS
jgi:hypothetical protein